MTKSFLTHVTRLIACECEDDGEDMVLVECQGGEGSVSLIVGAGRAPWIGDLVRVKVEVVA